MASILFEKALVKFIGPVQQVTDTFKKRILILTADFDTEYPTPIKIEIANAKCDDLVVNEIIPGDIVSVTANIRGNEWLNPKTSITEVINSFSLWKISLNKTNKAAGGSTPVYAAPPAYTPPPAGDGFAPPANGIDDSDDVPF